MFKKEIGQNPGILHRLFWFSIAINRAWLNKSEGGPWCSRKSRTAWQIVVLKFSPPEKQKIKRRNFGLKFSTFWAGSLVVRESRDRRNIISDKNSQNRRNIFMCLRFFQKWVRIPWNYFNFLAAEKLTFWEGGITSKLACQWPSWGVYEHAPTAFWRKRRVYTEKKVAK